MNAEVTIVKVVRDSESHAVEVYAKIDGREAYVETGERNVACWGWPKILAGGRYATPLHELPRLSEELRDQVLAAVGRAPERDATPYHKSIEA